MDDRSNTIAGWVLGAGIAALGLSIVSSKYYHADSIAPTEVDGYAVEDLGGEASAEQGPALATLLASADVAAGEKVFAKCMACHTIAAGGPAGVGPNIHAIMGKPIAAGSFAYSGALKAVGGNWTWEQMDAWLASPRKFANGTKMSFAGLGNAEDRANILAYLNAQGSNLPLPAAPAPATGDVAPADGEAGGDVPVTQGGANEIPPAVQDVATAQTADKSQRDVQEQ